MKLDHFLINLPNGLSLTFIGRCRDLDAETVELCAPDGRPVLQVPRRYVTSSTEERTAQRILDDALRHLARTN